MAKTARSPVKSKAKSTKPKSRRAAQPAQSAKSANAKRRNSAPAKKATAKKSAQARPRATTRSRSQPGRAAAKASLKRSSTRSRKTKPAGYVATLDGWCKDCTARVQELIHEYSARNRRQAKSRRARKQGGTPEWLASGARQLGLGLRRGARLADPRKIIQGTGKKIRHIKFNRVTDFCKKEWKDLSDLASRINDAANPPRPRPTGRAKK
jgi:hypothetical protein